MKKNFLALPLLLLVISITLTVCNNRKDNHPRKLEIFFLGHKSKHHDSEKLAEILSQEYFKQGINITCSTDPDDLTREDMHLYDGLILYANHDSISPAQEKALLAYVRSGKGFIPLHSASYCFRNSPEAIAMIGGQFKSHEYDSFPAIILKPEHPIMKGIPAFVTEDETYVHDKISKDIEVLTERVEGNHHEPYTWIHNYGEGRVFYTAYGHNETTWRNPGFLNLVRNGILWAVGDRVKTLRDSLHLPEPAYTAADIPNYEHRDPPPQLQHPLTPEQSMLLTQLPPGFEMQLFAAEPDIAKPIFMNWDERGRLWVAETVDYPNMTRENKEEGKDRIKILEDTDGDGKADKFTVFADKLNIPTSFVFTNGGIVVAQAPDFLFLQDTNNDDKADVRKTILTGWGTYDTHAGPSNLHYGPDNRLWGTVGYSGFKGVLPGSADTVQFAQGLYAFTPDGKQLEFLGSTTNNTWGLGFSEDFDVFLSTANNTHSAFFGIPKRYADMGPGASDAGIDKIDGHYAMHVVTKNLRQVDVHGGFTAAAGHSLYTARKFPREYWNRIAFVCEPTGRVIHKAILKPDGASFKEEDGWNFLASADEWFGPVQAEVGPDGALWMLDWYNFIIQHNPTPQGFQTGKGNAYVNPLRDSTKGRIYRIRYKNAKDDRILALSKEKPDDLIKALGNSNMFWRTTAQRLLVESGNRDVLDRLYRIIRDTSVDETGINAPAVHALWTLHGLKALNGDNNEALSVALGALKHPAAGVRRAAVQVLPPTAAVGKALIQAGALEDKDLRVVMATVLKTAEMPASDEIGKQLFNIANKPGRAVEDNLVQKAFVVAAFKHQSGISAAFKASGISEKVVVGESRLIHRITMRNKLDVLQLPQRGFIRPDRLPDLTNKEISFTAQVEARGRDNLTGVIVAQGNKENGYSLYINDRKKLRFQVNQGNKSFIIGPEDTLSARKFSVAIKLLDGGIMQLFMNDKELASGKAKGLFTIPLRTSGIRIGHDARSAGAQKAGDYEDSSRLAGTVSDTHMETLLIKSAAPDLGRPDQIIVIKTIPHEMKYDKTAITAKAGSVVEIVFDNPDFMQHNLLILRPGSAAKVGAAADALAQAPNGAAIQYVPDMPDVLYATPLVNPSEKYSLKFKVPDVPGSYPYICSYPGHWRIMNGVLTVRL